MTIKNKRNVTDVNLMHKKMNIRKAVKNNY